MACAGQLCRRTTHSNKVEKVASVVRCCAGILVCTHCHSLLVCTQCRIARPSISEHPLMLARAHIGVNTRTRDTVSMVWIADVVRGAWWGVKTIGHTPRGREWRGNRHVGARVVHTHIDIQTAIHTDRRKARRCTCFADRRRRLPRHSPSLIMTTSMPVSLPALVRACAGRLIRLVLMVTRAMLVFPFASVPAGLLRVRVCPRAFAHACMLMRPLRQMCCACAGRLKYVKHDIDRCPIEFVFELVDFQVSVHRFNDPDSPACP